VSDANTRRAEHRGQLALQRKRRGDGTADFGWPIGGF
jgi:hypothetical protein